MIFTTRFVLSLIGALAACGDAAEQGRAAAKREAAAERKKEQAAVKAVDRIEVAVPQGKHLPCTQLIDPAAYTSALGEIEVLTVRDGTKSMIDSTASCSLIRGGKRPDTKEQEKLMKKNGRLGVLPGDEVCAVTLYCWVVDDASRFAERCKVSPSDPPSLMRTKDSDTTGGFACKETRPQGEFDIDAFKFYDPDTRCLFAVRGGPSMTDNELIAACAKVARETINPEHIKMGAPARYELPPPPEAPAAQPQAAP